MNNWRQGSSCVFFLAVRVSQSPVLSHIGHQKVYTKTVLGFLLAQVSLRPMSLFACDSELCPCWICFAYIRRNWVHLPGACVVVVGRPGGQVLVLWVVFFFIILVKLGMGTYVILYKGCAWCNTHFAYCVGQFLIIVPVCWYRNIDWWCFDVI